MLNVTMLVFNDVYWDSRVLKEAESLSSSGCKVTIVGLVGNRESVPVDSLPFDVKLLQLESRKLKSKLFLPIKFAELILRNYRFLVDSKIDVIHSHDVGPMLVAWLVSRKKAIPIVYDSHELEYDRNLPSKLVRSLNRYYERLIIGKASQIIVSDGAYRANIMKKANDVVVPMTFVRNCPPQVFDGVSDSIDLREKLELPDDAKLLLYVGNAMAGRGISAIMDSLLLLPDDVILVMIGRFANKDALMNGVTQRGLVGRVLTIGPYPYDELVRYTASADVGLCLIENTCLSYYHSTPTKMFDYIAAGLPLLTSNFPAMEEIVQNEPDGPIGMSVDPKSPSDIADGVRRLLRLEKVEKDLMRKRMLEAHSKKYNWNVQEEKLLSVYKKYM